MGLREYERKRDFSVTPEPRGSRPRSGGRRYCVQKHAASRLHYDFRLELDGVLLSWAVPKGPSLDPADKRLAMQTEDHPIEYADFEGVIPAGEYGGGTVVLWDQGEWEPVGDVRQAYRAGALKFVLHGQKVRGGFALVRIKTKGQKAREDGRSWLLIKEKDADARPGYRVVDEEPLSVVSGRSLEEIAAARDRVWHSNVPAKEQTRSAQRAQAVARTSRRAKAPPSAAGPRSAPQARRAALPAFVPPQLATLVDRAPDGDEWVHEMKLDGYRILARLQRGQVRLLSRRDNDWSERFPEVGEAVAQLPAKQALLDGEVAVLLPDGTTSFQALQGFAQGSAGRLVYFVFDLLHLDGYDLTRSPLESRKAVLRDLLAGAPAPAAGVLSYSEHVVGSGPEFFAEACRLRLEGALCKRREGPYRPGRGRDWLKVKCSRAEEVVIGGYTPPKGSRSGLGALLVGVNDASGRLRYAGKVGTGFTDAMLADLKRRLDRLKQPTPPFADKPPRAAGVTWVRPELVAEVAFTEWTSDGRLRHPSFRGLREDKGPEEVVDSRQSRVERNGDGRIQGVRITNPERVVYPAHGTTKRDLALFYESIADWIVPHLKGRPTTLVRCPEGVEGECFYQKHSGQWAPESLRRVKIQEAKKVGEYLVVDDLAGLIGLVQLGILEIHTWNSVADHLEQPDRIVFDLDPDEGLPWTRTVEAAQRVREELEAVDLTSFVKTTGGKGLHVVVPLQRGPGWDEIAAFAEAVAVRLAAQDPARYTAVMSKAKRKGKVFIDYLRNHRGATSVAAYSTRARPNAPISTPLRWDELAADLRSDDFTIATLRARLAALKADPWAGYDKARQRLTRARIGKVVKDARRGVS